jgi:hypothetical protein
MKFIEMLTALQENPNGTRNGIESKQGRVLQTYGNHY